MLRELHVTNLGIVDDLTLLLGSGLTAITGETGAGTTLLVEAVDLLLGGRSDAGLVRTGADEARIEGRFEDEAGGEILLVRVIPAEGRSRAYIDGALATVAQLAEAGATLVDLHGQHAHQALLQGRAQRKSLDRFIGTKAQESLDRLRSARSERNQLDKDLSALGGDERERAREIDLLSFQLDEIERAAIEHAGEDVALEAEEALLSDATNFREALAKAYDAVQSRCRDALGEAVGALNGREPFSGIEQRLRSVEAELGDVADEIRGTLERVVDDPERIEAVRSRRRLLREFTRKYGETLADVLEFAQEIQVRLAELDSYEVRAAEIEERIAQSDAVITESARSLSQARQKASPVLANEVMSHFADLALPNARLEVSLEVGQLTDDGFDEVTFLLAANSGEDLKPLARAASGGEMSRIMLALRLVLSDAPATLVFDEVDAGIGGEAGVAVGRLLAQLGTRHQVLCVTHLAQVASHADNQVTVEKIEVEHRTVAQVSPVVDEKRRSELARMLGGIDTDHARSLADELLSSAADSRVAKKGQS